MWRGGWDDLEGVDISSVVVGQLCIVKCRCLRFIVWLELVEFRSPECRLVSWVSSGGWKGYRCGFLDFCERFGLGGIEREDPWVVFVMCVCVTICGI